jgi:catechol 2,3-dioxygenase-like lactoylglutathione lyase family enzyme
VPDRNQKHLEALSRRALLGALGGAAASATFAPAALAQGGCRDGYGQAASSRCPLPMEQAIAPIAEVFDSTGWKTTALEHVTIDVVDYKKEAAFYIALMGWKLRSDDGKQAVLDIGNWGNAILRGASPDSFTPSNGGAARRSEVKNFAWVIDKWDAKKVAAELTRRGMTPVADNRGAFESFHVKDPDGWDLQICNNKGLAAARKTPAAARLSEPAPFSLTGWKTVWLDHISFRVSDYKASASYYANLLGWQRTYDEGTENELLVGDVGDVLCRGGNPFVPAQANAPKGAMIDHISFGISPWDVEAVRSALESRGLKVQIDTSAAHLGPDGKITQDDVYQAAFQSYHTETPNGFNLQISWNTIDKRLALATAVKPKALRKYRTAVQQPMGLTTGN